MSGWYIRPGLFEGQWEVGHYDPAGDWVCAGEYWRASWAMEIVSFLNGNPDALGAVERDLKRAREQENHE